MAKTKKNFVTWKGIINFFTIILNDVECKQRSKNEIKF